MDYVCQGKSNRCKLRQNTMGHSLWLYVMLNPLRYILILYFQFTKAESNPKASKWDIDFLTGRLVNEGRDSWTDF